jgi:DsbC/DsbD-like thiol-disulfide interchange protein
MSKLRIFAVAAVLGLSAGAALPARSQPAGEPTSEPAAASPWTELHAARTRLVASAAAGAGGVRLAGVEIAMDDGWKTYWRMPGDAGVPPEVDWSGSTNVAGIKVLYPAPKRMQEAGGEVIGYKHGVLFPIEVRPQDAGKPVVLKLAVEFGICREICVPATATLDLTLPPAVKTAQNDIIAAALDRVPRAQAARRASDPELRRVTIVDGKAGARLTIAAAFPGGKSPDAFVEAPDGLYVPLPHKEAADADGTVRFTANLAPDVANDIKGKTLAITLVSEAGATEARWTVP